MVQPQTVETQMAENPHSSLEGSLPWAEQGLLPLVQHPMGCQQVGSFIELTGLQRLGWEKANCFLG